MDPFKSHTEKVSRLDLLNRTIRFASKTKLYSNKNLPSQPLSSLDELSDLPLTSKQDLRNAYPFDGLAVPIKKVIELHTSSGTTGKVSLSYFTKKDLITGSDAISEAWKCFGVTEESRVQFMMSYGLFSGAPLNSYAIQKLGALVIPVGIQPAEKQVQIMLDFKVDTIVATPGYYFYLYDYITEKGIPIEKFSLKRGVAAGEIYSEKVRLDIEKKFKIKIFDHYGLCEINTGIAYECGFKTGLHFIENYVIPEIINPLNGKISLPGQEGELVLTTLGKEASPVIRYRTGDITTMSTDKCPCGRSSVRIDRIKRRIDDLIFIKGIKIDPHELKEYIFELAGNYIYSDIKIKVGGHSERQKAEILVSLRDPSNTAFLDIIAKSLKSKTLLNFEVKNVNRDYFEREGSNKIKFFEYVDKE